MQPVWDPGSQPRRSDPKLQALRLQDKVLPQVPGEPALLFLVIRQERKTESGSALAERKNARVTESESSKGRVTPRVARFKALQRPHLSPRSSVPKAPPQRRDGQAQGVPLPPQRFPTTSPRDRPDKRTEGGHGDRWPPAALGADAHVGAPARPQDPEPKPDPPTLTQHGAAAQASRRLSCPALGSVQATRDTRGSSRGLEPPVARSLFLGKNEALAWAGPTQGLLRGPPHRPPQQSREPTGSRFVRELLQVPISHPENELQAPDPSMPTWPRTTAEERGCVAVAALQD